jgi:hypothetical protein
VAAVSDRAICASPAAHGGAIVAAGQRDRGFVSSCDAHHRSRRAKSVSFLQLTPASSTGTEASGSWSRAWRGRGVLREQEHGRRLAAAVQMRLSPVGYGRTGLDDAEEPAMQEMAGGDGRHRAVHRRATAAGAAGGRWYGCVGGHRRRLKRESTEARVGSLWRCWLRSPAQRDLAGLARVRKNQNLTKHPSFGPNYLQIDSCILHIGP